VFAFGYAEAGGKIALPNIPKMNSALERNARSPCYAAGKFSGSRLFETGRCLVLRFSGRFILPHLKDRPLTLELSRI